MAFTIGREYTTFGNKRIAILSCTVDAASGNIVTGLKTVHGFSLGPIAMATTSVSLLRNTGANATAIAGTINLGSATSGDKFFLVVYGV